MSASHVPLAAPGAVEDDGIAADPALVAVLAHGLLGGLSVLRTAIHTLAHPSIEETKRADVVSLADSQLEMMADTLRSLALGLPAVALDYLDHLASDRPAPAPESDPEP